MLVTDEVLFIHAPKTAGMAVTDYLIANLPGQKTLTLPPGHGRRQHGVEIVPGTRHENMHEAIERLARMGRTVDDLRLFLAVIRNPYDLEVSRYHYYRLGHPWDKGKLQDLAMTGDFDRFCREALYPYIGAPRPIETYYTLDGHLLPMMRLLRFEYLSLELAAALRPFVTGDPIPLERVNSTAHAHFSSYINPRNEPAIFEKYRWLFRFYERARF
jgi:hypothetical protein